MSEQKRKNKPEDATGYEKAEEQAVQLLQRLREAEAAKDRPTFFTFLLTYLGLVGAIADVGALASYVGHKKAAEAFLWISGSLVALIPIILVVYVSVVLHKHFSPLEDTALGRFLRRNFRTVNSIGIAGDFINIVLVITFDFDRHPKVVLVFVVALIAHAVAMFGMILQHDAYREVSEARSHLFEGIKLALDFDKHLIDALPELTKNSQKGKEGEADDKAT